MIGTELVLIFNRFNNKNGGFHFQAKKMINGIKNVFVLPMGFNYNPEGELWHCRVVRDAYRKGSLQIYEVELVRMLAHGLQALSFVRGKNLKNNCPQWECEVGSENGNTMYVVDDNSEIIPSGPAQIFECRLVKLLYANGIKGFRVILVEIVSEVRGCKKLDQSCAA